MKERMPEGMENLAVAELKEADEKFVAAAIIGNARNMARFSIGQTPPPNFDLERATDLEVARHLSDVQVDDKSLAQNIKEALDRNLTDPDGAFQAASLTVAKAIATATEEVVLPNERGFFKRVSDKVVKEMGQLIASKSGKKGLAVVSGLSLVATACGQVAQGAEPSRPIDLETPTAVATEVRPTSTPFSPVPPTEIATPTPEVVRDEWQVSADGLILYNEAELYGGMFTMNPERTGYLYEQLMRSLYQINVAGENMPFLRQFPTLEAFIQYAHTGQPINNMWIAIDHPGSGVRYLYQATWAPVEPVDLSSTAVAIVHLTYDDIVHPTTRDERPFFPVEEGLGELVIERVEINGRFVIRFTFKQSLYDDPAYGTLGLSDDYPPEHNLSAITQLMNVWSWEVDHMRDDADDIRITGATPPIFNITKSWPSEGEFREMAEDVENSPFVLR